MSPVSNWILNINTLSCIGQNCSRQCQFGRYYTYLKNWLYMHCIHNIGKIWCNVEYILWVGSI
jgi:hypothetical protein